MPYSNGCRMEVVNLGGTAQTARMSAAVDTALVPGGGTLRFHAKYPRSCFNRLDAARLAPARTAGRCCWRMAHTTALPAFICISLTPGTRRRRRPDPGGMAPGIGRQSTGGGAKGMRNALSAACVSPTFGTGSEDCIGYAWAAEPPFTRFDSPYACLNAMPIDENGHTAVSRLHIADSVPLTSSFEGFIEKYKGDG